MPPRESSASPAPQGSGQQPFPRRRLSVDGVSSVPIRRPVYGGRPQPMNRAFAPQPVASQNYPKVWSDVVQPSPVASPPLPALQPAVAPVVQMPDTPFTQPLPNPEQVLQPPVPQPQQPVLQPTPEMPAWKPLPTIKPIPGEELEPEVQEPQPEPKKVKKPRRRPHINLKKKVILVPLAVIAALGIICGGTYGFLHWRSVQANPVTIFNNALKSAFTTTSLQYQSDSNGDSKQVSLDLSSLKQPIASVQASQTIAGQVVQYSGYGSTANTYFSYTNLPATIPASLSNVAKNASVQLRSNGMAATGISSSLNSLPDPRYEAFGPLLFANVPVVQQKQLISFISSHNIYAFKQTAVSRSIINNQKVLVYPVTINNAYLKILNQSLASIEGFTPTDVQAAVASLNNLSSGTLYVSAKTHQFVELAYTLNSQPTTISYSYGAANIPAEPQTKLTWTSFSALEYQIEAQLSSGLSNADRDASRQADLSAIHTALASYEATNGFYPTLANMNDQNWVATNLSGLDPEVFRDPQATSLNLLDKPTAGNYAYEPTPDSGKGSCVNAGTDPCTHYQFTSILSTNKPIVVNDP